MTYLTESRHATCNCGYRCHELSVGESTGCIRETGKMRNRLQYLYSIFVFFGVLFTAYYMMDRDDNVRLPIGGYQSPELTTEATLVDPGLTSLFEMEDQLKKQDRKEKADQKRLPTQSKPK